MHFNFKPGSILRGRLAYVQDDQSISFDPITERSTTTAALVVARTLQLEFDVPTGKVLYAWGYAPKASWIATAQRININNAIESELFVNDINSEIGMGFDTSLAGSKIYYNSDESTLIVGDTNYDKLLHIADSTYVGLSNGDIMCLVLTL